MAQRDRAMSMRALAYGNQIRSAGALLKKEMKKGAVDPVVVMRGDDAEWEPFVRPMKLGAFLRSVPTFGPRTVEDFLAHVSLSSDVRLRALTYERRGELAELIDATLRGDEINPMRIAPAP